MIPRLQHHTHLTSMCCTKHVSGVLIICCFPPHTHPAFRWGGVTVTHCEEYSMLGCQGVYHSASVLLTCHFLSFCWKPHSEVMAYTLFLFTVLCVYWQERLGASLHSTIIILHFHPSLYMNMVSWYKMFIFRLNGKGSMLNGFAAFFEHHSAGARSREHFLS